MICCTTADKVSKQGRTFTFIQLYLDYIKLLADIEYLAVTVFIKIYMVQNATTDFNERLTSYTDISRHVDALINQKSIRNSTAYLVPWLVLFEVSGSAAGTIVCGFTNLGLVVCDLHTCWHFRPKTYFVELIF